MQKPISLACLAAGVALLSAGVQASSPAGRWLLATAAAAIAFGLGGFA